MLLNLLVSLSKGLNTCARHLIVGSNADRVLRWCRHNEITLREIRWFLNSVIVYLPSSHATYGSMSADFAVNFWLINSSKIRNTIPSKRLSRLVHRLLNLHHSLHWRSASLGTLTPLRYQVGSWIESWFFIWSLWSCIHSRHSITDVLSSFCCLFDRRELLR